MEDKKKKFLDALERSLGVVTPACKECGICRATYYNWYNDDVEFRKEVDYITELAIDFVENQMFKLIKEGNDKLILFFMKYKGKKRGYSNEIDITSGGQPIIFNTNLIRSEEDIPEEDNDEEE